MIYELVGYENDFGFNMVNESLHTDFDSAYAVMQKWAKNELRNEAGELTDFFGSATHFQMFKTRLNSIEEPEFVGIYHIENGEIIDDSDSNEDEEEMEAYLTSEETGFLQRIGLNTLDNSLTKQSSRASSERD